MPRVRGNFWQRAGQFLSTLALLLFLATLTLWIRSYSVADFIRGDRPNEQTRIWSRWEFWVQRGSFRLGRSLISQEACLRTENMTGWPDGWEHQSLSSTDPPILAPWDALSGRV